MKTEYGKNLSFTKMFKRLVLCVVTQPLRKLDNLFINAFSGPLLSACYITQDIKFSRNGTNNASDGHIYMEQYPNYAPGIKLIQEAKHIDIIVESFDHTLTLTINDVGLTPHTDKGYKVGRLIGKHLSGNLDTTLTNSTVVFGVQDTYHVQLNHYHATNSVELTLVDSVSGAMMYYTVINLTSRPELSE